MQQWAEKHGKQPAANQWVRAKPSHPNSRTVERVFGSWNNAIREAGFEPRPPHRSYTGREWTRRDVCDAIYAWRYRNGSPPKGSDWRVGSEDWPPLSRVVAIFGSWTAAIVEAGYEPLRGRH